MKALLERIRDLQPDIRAARPEMEASRRLPASLAERFRDAGIFRLCVPKDYGGEEVDPLSLALTLEDLARADASAAWCAMIGATTGSLAAYLAPGEALAIFGDPQAVMTGAYAPSGRARSAPGGYQVRGRWRWNSGGAASTWLCAGCSLEAADGTMSGAPQSRLMIFPANEATFIDTWKTSGLRGTGSGDFEVADLIVPPERSVSLTDDQPICTGALYRFPIFGLLSIGIASVASGNALAALEEFKATALAKRHAGGRVMAERSAVQGLFAGAFIELRGARAVFMEEIDAAWRQANAGKTITAEQRGRLRLSATHLTRTSAEIVRRLQDAAGGDAVFLDNALNRRVLDAQTMTAHIMVAPATIELAGRALLGLPVSSLEL